MLLRLWKHMDIEVQCEKPRGGEWIFVRQPPPASQCLEIFLFPAANPIFRLLSDFCYSHQVGFDKEWAVDASTSSSIHQGTVRRPSSQTLQTLQVHVK